MKPQLTIIKARPASAPVATYAAGLRLVRRIDADLTRNTRHYRRRDGRLLTTLDEVVRAILADDLMAAEPERLAA